MEREDVQFTSGRDRCAAWLFRPTSTDGPAPCVVMGSGFSCVRDQGLDAYGERFAAAGFAVLAFDYRGFSDSGGKPRSLVLDKRQREDWLAAIAYARSLDIVDGQGIALWGYSQGGGHVQSLALSEAGIKAGICVTPLIDAARTMRHIGGMRHIWRLTVSGARDGLRALRSAEPFYIPVAGPPGSAAAFQSPKAVSGFEAITPPGSSWKNETCARTFLVPSYRLARQVRRIEIPILYCIAESDDVVPPALGMKAASRPPRGELRTYPGGHFDPFLGETFERMAADQVEFLSRQLRSDSGAPSQAAG